MIRDTKYLNPAFVDLERDAIDYIEKRSDAYFLFAMVCISLPFLIATLVGSITDMGVMYLSADIPFIEFFDEYEKKIGVMWYGLTFIVVLVVTPFFTKRRTRVTVEKLRNKLYFCSSCKKYFRGYQVDLNERTLKNEINCPTCQKDKERYNRIALKEVEKELAWTEHHKHIGRRTKKQIHTMLKVYRKNTKKKLKELDSYLDDMYEIKTYMAYDKEEFNLTETITETIEDTNNREQDIHSQLEILKTKVPWEGVLRIQKLQERLDDLKTIEAVEKEEPKNTHLPNQPTTNGEETKLNSENYPEDTQQKEEQDTDSGDTIDFLGAGRTRDYITDTGSLLTINFNIGRRSKHKTK